MKYDNIFGEVTNFACGELESDRYLIFMYSHGSYFTQRRHKLNKDGEDSPYLLNTKVYLGTINKFLKEYRPYVETLIKSKIFEDVLWQLVPFGYNIIVKVVDVDNHLQLQFKKPTAYSIKSSVITAKHKYNFKERVKPYGFPRNNIIRFARGLYTGEANIKDFFIWYLIVFFKNKRNPTRLSIELLVVMEFMLITWFDSVNYSPHRGDDGHIIPPVYVAKLSEQEYCFLKLYAVNLSF